MKNHSPARTDNEIAKSANDAANRNEAIDTLARTIWAEARGEGKAGMEAVAAVILNRVAKPCWWGRTIVTVCLKPWQFSCWNQDDPNRAKLLSVGKEDAAFRIALEIAERAVDGQLPDSTGGATHYHTASVSPSWARGQVPIKTIGNHLFYKGIA